jgi:hypothetical protein
MTVVNHSSIACVYFLTLISNRTFLFHHRPFYVCDFQLSVSVQLNSMIFSPVYHDLKFRQQFLVYSVFITIQFQYEYDVEHWSVTSLINHCNQSRLLRRNQKFHKLMNCAKMCNKQKFVRRTGNCVASHWPHLNVTSIWSQSDLAFTS